MVKANKPLLENKNKSLLTGLKPHSNTINSIIFAKKTKAQIDKEHYQKNKEKKKAQQKERYTKKKQQTELAIQQAWGKYYGAEAIRVLMSLKEYTELNQQKRKIWLNFVWTFKGLKEMGTPNNIIEIMKFREEAENLINDYWDTAKSEVKKGKSWNSLADEQQQRLIKYWGYEKARIENEYLTEQEKLERKSQEYLKEIELAKFHEERGKIKCPCWKCEGKLEAKAKIAKEQKELEKAEADNEKGECFNCEKFRVLNEDGACQKCSIDYD